jgi:hypothetical protein
MAKKTVTGLLNAHFNKGDGVSLASENTSGGVPEKRGVAAFRDELAALTDAEKRELAEGICAITGDTILEAAK